MSLIVPGSDEAVVVRSADAEAIGRAPTTVRLLADSSATGGALSAQRVTLAGGVGGATPRHHERSAEMFHALDGAPEFLAGEEAVTAGQGDLDVVPPRMPHASPPPPAATPICSSSSQPGVERFEYLRHLQRIALGEPSPESLLEVRERCDNHFLNSAVREKRH
ncbi:cupin domain-containing protein [Streptomyces sp. NPDC048312]|uniref:cupin domain-containing protein n=1 Tax=Streptomyces sp. NPDC048312 TaxID=3155485 RepID=UPI0033FC9F0D